MFLATERLLLRRFTEDDVDNLEQLDGDPDVMRFVTGGRLTPRDEIENEVLPAFLGYYERYPGYGFWAAIEASTGRFLGWFHFRPDDPAKADEVELGYRLRKDRLGAGATRPRAHARWSRRGSRSSAWSESSRRPWS